MASGQIKSHVEFNREGFRDVLRSPDCIALVTDTTNELLNRANALGSGFTWKRTNSQARYRAKVFYGGFGGGRYVGIVATGNFESVIDESKNKTLEKAL